MEASTVRTPRLALGFRRIGAMPCLTLRGELISKELGTFEDALMAIEEVWEPVVVLDLRELSFVDSGGLSALLDAQARARSASRRLFLTPPADPVMRLFRLTLLDRRFDWVDGDRLDAAMSTTTAIDRDPAPIGR